VCERTCVNFLCLDEALRDPLVLLRDKDFDDRDCYYGPPVLSVAVQGFHDTYLKVVVEFEHGRGRVVTAYSVDMVSPDDRPLAPR
jgi:hypothetical protein